jgi:hypothetical protein
MIKLLSLGDCIRPLHARQYEYIPWHELCMHTWRMIDGEYSVTPRLQSICICEPDNSLSDSGLVLRH